MLYILAGLLSSRQFIYVSSFSLLDYRTALTGYDKTIYLSLHLAANSYNLEIVVTKKSLVIIEHF